MENFIVGSVQPLDGSNWQQFRLKSRVRAIKMKNFIVGSVQPLDGSNRQQFRFIGPINFDYRMIEQKEYMTLKS